MSNSKMNRMEPDVVLTNGKQSSRIKAIFPSSSSKSRVIAGQKTSTEKINSKSSTKANVIIVDDEKSIVSLFQTIVSRAGYTVQSVAYDGREAISQVEKAVNSSEPVNVVIIDQRMPHVDGFEASRRIKEIAPTVKIIMISAYDVPVARSGVVDLFIPKPVSRSQLLASLDQVLSS